MVVLGYMKYKLLFSEFFMLLSAASNGTVAAVPAALPLTSMFEAGHWIETSWKQ